MPHLLLYAVSITAKGWVSASISNIMIQPIIDSFCVFMILILIDNDHVRVMTLEINNTHRAVRPVYLSFARYLSFK